jgi:hypothetical protein
MARTGRIAKSGRRAKTHLAKIANTAARLRAGKKSRPLPQPENPDEPVWRYMDLAKYVDLLARKKLHMCRVDCFEDPFEASLPDGHVPAFRKRMRLFREARRNTYVSCWRRGSDESEAMWKLYCGDAGGVAIVLPYSDLRQTAQQGGCVIGLVSYIDYSKHTFPDATDIVWASMYKRIAFAHEREIRVVCKRSALKRLKGEPPSGIDIDWDPERWVEKIVLSPLSEDYFCTAVHKVTEALAPKLAKRFVRSQMRRAPNV